MFVPVVAAEVVVDEVVGVGVVVVEDVTDVDVVVEVIEELGTDVFATVEVVVIVVEPVVTDKSCLCCSVPWNRYRYD